MKQFFLLLVSFSLLALGCKKEDQNEIDRNIILKYLADNNLTAVEDAAGFFYIIEIPGSEAKPTVANEVSVRYKGYLPNGNVFDQTSGTNVATFQLRDVIAGWQLGIPKFGRGGKGVLLIPSRLGYGDRAISTIPANSVLIFDVELVNF